MINYLEKKDGAFLRTPLLAIQFPYTEDRLLQVNSLIVTMVKQIEDNNYNDLICMNLDSRGKEISIGEKRNDLYKLSPAKYTVQWDSDDNIHPQGLKLIIEALQNNPDVDCCTYEEYIDMDGKIQRSNHSLKYDDWHDVYDGYDYVRTPFMKSVIKTEIAKSVPVPFIRYSEDYQWAKALKEKLKTEIHIDKQIYRYIHKSTNEIERYGLDRD